MAADCAAAVAAHPIMRVVACGSVDDGKSTLIGRLLAETASVPDDLLDYARKTRRGGSTVPAGEVDFSLLTDGLEAEHAQGITIDVAYRHLYLPSGRRAIIADAPGHEQYTRNMAVAASTADVAILLIDATKGIRLQTHRHLTVCALMRVRSVIVAVNKMDAVGYRQAIFEELACGVCTAAAGLGIDDVTVIPVSAIAGDNVVTASAATAWYNGRTLLDALSLWKPSPLTEEPVGLRLPVQYVVRADGFRGYAGTLTAGRLRVGDEIAVAQSGVVAKVSRVLAAGWDTAEVATGTAVMVEFDREVDVGRGDLLIDAPPAGTLDYPANAFSADLVWTGEQPLMRGRSYLMVAGVRTVPAVVTAVRGRRDVSTGQELAARNLTINDIGVVEIVTDTPVPLDEYRRCRDSGGFILVDRLTRDTVAAGMTRHALRRGRTVAPQDFVVDRAARGRLMGQRPQVVWLTGRPGAGKSTIADAVERRLHARGLYTYVLDGDNVRTGLNKDLGFTPEDRSENVRRVAETAKLMRDAGLIVIVSLVSPFRSDRRAARDLLNDGDFVEVFVDTPADVCVQRDPKGLYAKAHAGAIPNMTGVGQAYEPPDAPEVVLDGTADLDAATALLIKVIMRTD
ncbi:MAG TPA: adenylyl-sulfate kinase [Pseudonocardiaceae bacterium]|nr:adenylyl-sulfate kinase [Pseudonocardiaceae bacterium]